MGVSSSSDNMESKFITEDSIKDLLTKGEVEMSMEFVKVRVKERARDAIQIELAPLEKL